MSYSSNFLAEKFIQTIARAFYTDTIIVVLDALLREKYIREEELGPRLRMSQKQAREAVATLVDIDMLLKCEEIPLPDIDYTVNPNSKQVVKFYYIDYQSFVNIVRLRVYYMMKSVQSQERSEVDDIYFECPTCHTKYSSLQAMRQRSADYKFICPNCCPDFDLSKTVSQPYFRLKEVDNRGKLSNVQKLEKKMKEQLSRSSDHDGILEILEDLKNIPLNRNKPSTNIRRGIRTSAVKNSEVAAEINDIVNSKSSKPLFDIKEKHFNLLSTRLDGTVKTNSSVIEESSIKRKEATVSSDIHDDHDNIQETKRIKQSNLPEFFHESGVKGSSAIMQEVQALHVERGIAFTSNDTSIKHGDEHDKRSQSTILFSRDTKSVTTITNTVNVTNSNRQTIKSSLEEDNEDDDEEEDENDIQWEDENEGE